MSNKNHRSGGKMGGKHTTVIDASKPIVDFLLKHPDVAHVIAGHIKMGIGAAPQRLKLREESGCLFVKVRGSASVQELRVFSQNVKKVKNDLENAFERLCDI
ncbi:MAG: DUF2103 domain-containing protein [Parcubacteria group bacterium]|jgi:hypothetical protein